MGYFLKTLKNIWKSKVWQGIELNTDTHVMPTVAVFLMMATLYRNLKKDSLQTNGLTLKGLAIEGEQKSY